MSKKDRNERKELEDYGIVFIAGEINDGVSSTVCEEVIRINASGESDFIQMIINSPGGYCSAGFAIVDMMEWSRLPVYTTGLGLIASMSLVIFMAGEKGHRVITPRTSILSHRFSAFSFGNHSELVAKRKEEDLMHKRLVEHYVRHTNLKSERDVVANLLRDVDTWLTPEEALQMGVADTVQKDRSLKNTNGE
ncbi:MAG TPA: ClpP family protease [archaeon]|nr:ClpP family protease [archaeon]